MHESPFSFLTTPRPPGYAGTTATYRCSIAVSEASGTTVAVRYRGLPGNQPKLYDNFVAIWPGTVVPWTIPAQRRVSIGVDAQDGSTVLDRVQITNERYTVAYAVGRRRADICATAVLGKHRDTARRERVDVAVGSVGQTSLVVRYQTPFGYRPATNGNWIGLWPGEASPYDAPDPMARVAIADDANEGAAALNADLAAGTTYTLVYFTGRKTTTAAALVTFRTPEP
jgi:hypothetical protein